MRGKYYFAHIHVQAFSALAKYFFVFKYLRHMEQHNSQLHSHRPLAPHRVHLIPPEGTKLRKSVAYSGADSGSGKVLGASGIFNTFSIVKYVLKGHDRGMNYSVFQ
jgi:hypothetical protein